jgi:SAM-dependent methyltransferase/rhodanese-related sulfurtransferase
MRSKADALLHKARRTIDRLSPSESAAAVIDGALLVDIRSDSARALDGIVPGSVHIPRTVLEWRLDPASEWRNPHLDLDACRPILLCDHGWSSSLAAQTLRQTGHSDACDVIGGFEAWQAEGLPVIEAPPPPPETELPGMGPVVGDLAALMSQRSHWQSALRDVPDRYGAEPSGPALAALATFAAYGTTEILELGCGQGRDTLAFARHGMRVTATDFAPAAVETTRSKALEFGLSEAVRVVELDVRRPLPFHDASFDACYSHMLFCMALTERELTRLAGDVLRVLRPGGVCVYTARLTDDLDFGRGAHLGEAIYELDGFVVHFFDRALIDRVAAGFELVEVEPFDEGSLPRRLARVTMRRPTGG